MSAYSLLVYVTRAIGCACDEQAGAMSLFGAMRSNPQCVE